MGWGSCSVRLYYWLQQFCDLSVKIMNFKLQLNNGIQYLNNQKIHSVLVHCTDHSGCAVYGMNCLLSLKHWDRGFESHLNHWCLWAFILFFVLSYVQVAAFRRADLPSKESYRLYKSSRNWKSATRPNKGQHSHRQTDLDYEECRLLGCGAV
jgi:hypothetical protein